jgi:hypothetical protein
MGGLFHPSLAATRRAIWCGAYCHSPLRAVLKAAISRKGIKTTVILTACGTLEKCFCNIYLSIA